MHRLGGRAAAVVFVLLAASVPASATPVTLTFHGTWGYFDPYDHTPEFHDAMAAFGIPTMQGGVGTPVPLTLALILDIDAAVLNPFGYYSLPIATHFSAGSLELFGGFTPGGINLGSRTISAGFGPTFPLVAGYRAPDVQLELAWFGSFPSTPPQSLAALIATIGQYSTPFAFMGFNGFQHIVTSQFAPAIVSVPETSALPGLALGLAILWTRHRVRRRFD